jgi:hypothetical protein
LSESKLDRECKSNAPARADCDGLKRSGKWRTHRKKQLEADTIMSMQKHRGSLVWLIAWLSLGSAVWLASPRSAQNHAKANATSLSAISDKKPNQEDRLSSSGKRLKSIERVEVGQRVATGISQEIRDLAIGDPMAVPQWDRVDHEIDSQTWRKLTLVMHTPQGDRFDITLLRPIGWLESCNAQVGSSIHLVVSEQGLDGLADVLAIEPCPRISSGVGRVVTGTFTHVRGGILRIRLAGLAKPLGVTSNHSIYSADRMDFVPAGELRVGDTLRNLEGDVRIESIEQLGSEERVYNLEIHGEHVFRVASSGVLVHNSSGAEGSVSAAQRSNGQLVQDIATRAEAWGTRRGLSTKGSVEGTLKHGYADRLLTRYQEMYGSRGLSTEVRYANGVPWREGVPLRGTVRLDVVEGPLNNPTAIFD